MSGARPATGYRRFGQDNMAAAVAKAKEDGVNHFKILGQWWKEIDPELKEKYNSDKDFVHNVTAAAPAKKGKK